MKFRAVIAPFVLSVICAAISFAQLPASSPLSGSAAYGENPEDAYLSPTRYTNGHFGFSIDLPPSLNLAPMPQPASLDRRIQLLELVGRTSPFAAVSISAYEYKNKNFTDAKSLLRRQLDQELMHGVEELHGIAKTTVGGRQFYYYESRQGIDQHMSLAAEMDGYVLQIDLRTRDSKVLHDLFADIAQMEFFPTTELAKRAGAGATPYQGPAISEVHLRQVRESEPATRIDPGKVAGNVYRNSQIGVSYELPPGWNVKPVGAIEAAVERYREKVLGEPLLGPRERAVVKLCRKTLFSAWRTLPDTDGEVPYDDFGEVTLSVMPLSCFPNIRFPSDIKDSAGIRQFVVGLNFTQPLQRDMTSVGAFENQGRVFIVTRGTIAYKEQGDALSRRVSVAIAMTEHRGYLLMWLLAAPHESELRELLAMKAAFDTPPPGHADTVAGGEPQPQKDGASSNSDATQPGGSAATDSAKGLEQSPAVTPAAAAYRPSLRAPGEDASGAVAGQKPASSQPN